MIRQKIFATVTAVCLALVSGAQISMTLQVPPAGLMQKTQLWNMLLVNASNKPVDIKVQLSLQDPATSQVLLTAESRVITLSSGATQLQPSSVSPVLYNYYSSIFNMDRSPEGLLPAGNFLACYTATSTGQGHTAIYAENCLEINVGPLSPPQLNMPADNSVLTQPYPQFSWLPPAPVNIFNDLSYDFILTEVLNGQSSTEAIQQNIPVYSTGNYHDLYCNYPSANNGLDTGKLYAWRIVARNNNNIIAQSDIWTFRVRQPSPMFESHPGLYTRLQKEPGAALAVCTGIVRFQYNNAVNDSIVSYKITALDDGRQGVIQSGLFIMSPGENLIDIPVNGSAHLKEGGRYLFQIVNARNEKWHLKFVYYKLKVHEVQH